ncbi:hypothetical protein ACFV24_33655 [Nocardia fluminea]
MRSLGTSVSAAIGGAVPAAMTTDFAGHAVPSAAGVGGEGVTNRSRTV